MTNQTILKWFGLSFSMCKSCRFDVPFDCDCFR